MTVTRTLELGWSDLLSAAVVTMVYRSDSARREGDRPDSRYDWAYWEINECDDLWGERTGDNGFLFSL